MKYALGIAIRFLSSYLETSCARSEYKDLLPAIAIIPSVELCRDEKLKKKLFSMQHKPCFKKFYFLETNKKWL